ncbi:hypothetical protein BH09MYX1_BH09MYX1_00410 [soil metagenome]
MLDAMQPPILRRPRLPSFSEDAARAPTPVSRRVTLALAFGALGVVYGDLGTNPLFALAEAFGGDHPLPIERLTVLGVLSLIFWALTLVVTLKYLTFVMRASNGGEGGILALLALIPTKHRPKILVFTILFGASLLYGDGVVTPAISVLSAVEGLKLAAPPLAPYIVEITVAILVVLFLVQRRGTEGIGFVFGPVMALWFIVIASLGIRQIIHAPEVLEAIDPRSAIRFCAARPKEAFTVLGAVILCIAGAEALYADMGHFGRKPIAIAWYGLVLPSLVLDYFGQGAFLLSGGKPGPSVFYATVPPHFLVPMVILSAFATVIASQALISGAYSLTQQAVQLGYSPRITVVHTSAGHRGQIYVPEVNWALMAACVALVVGFRSSDRLAAAYGLAVMGTMSVTTLAYFVVLVRAWKWPLYRAVPLCLVFAAIDLAFLSANLRKFVDGGWVPVSHRAQRLHPFLDMDRRARSAWLSPPRDDDSAPDLPRRRRRDPTASRSRDRRVPDGKHRRRSNALAAPFQTQPSATRDGDPSYDLERRRALRRARQALRVPGARTWLSTSRCALRVYGNAECA